MSNCRGSSMSEQEELDSMPIWQNHEQRITTLENTFAGFSHKIDAVDKKMENVESKIDSGNNEQKKLLNTLIGHHLETSKMKISNFWKVILNITGAGGLLAAVIYALVQFLGG